MDPLRSIAAWLVRRWLASLRWKSTRIDMTDPVIYCVWHRDVPAAGGYLRGRDVSSLVSLSSDGDFLVRILSGGRMEFARGSDSKGAMSGTRALLRRLHSGRSVATTWDGPKGPAGVPKPGPAWLARMTGAPLVELRFEYGSHLVLSDWSGLRLPAPFSLIRVAEVRA